MHLLVSSPWRLPRKHRCSSQIIWYADTHYDQVREMLSQSHEFWRQRIAADHDILYISSEVSAAASGTLCNVLSSATAS